MMIDPCPISPEALHRRGTKRADVLLISGDAYVDHPSFGTAVVARTLEYLGLTVAVAAQPPWRDVDSIRAFGRPRLFVGVSAGNMDSMVNHQTAHRKRRHDDAYTPGGRSGMRPNRAAVVYAQLARAAFPDALVLMGGVEASLRRFAHYDYWADKLRRSALVDGRADLLVYGMAERPLAAIVARLAAVRGALGRDPDRRDAPRLFGLRGTAFVVGQREVERRDLSLSEGRSLSFGSHGWCRDEPSLPASWPFADPTGEDRGAKTFRVRRIPSYERILDSPRLLVQATRAVERSQNPELGEILVQRHGAAFLVVAPPARPLSTEALDTVHELPFSRRQHPDYDEPVPAALPIACSVQTNRGCFGGCSFCAITLHEGRTVQSRSRASLLREVRALVENPVFRGTVTDLGGPTANTWRLGCRDPRVAARCRRPSCLAPEPCPRLSTDHAPLRALLADVRAVPGVRHVFIASGMRTDLLAGRSAGFLEEIVRHHTGGHLHVAPEHSDTTVLRLARKPPYEQFERFREDFRRARRRAGVERYLNPYFVSGLPGAVDSATAELASLLRAEGWRPRQVQSFLPTPGSAATAMFWGRYSPDRLDEAVEMPRRLADKIRQHRLLTDGLPSSPPRRKPEKRPRSV